MTAFIKLNKDTVRKTCKRFWSHLETVVEADGKFFEQIQSIVFQDILM